MIRTLFLLLLSTHVLAQRPPPAWCTAQQREVVPHSGCDERVLLADAVEVLTWMESHDGIDRDVLACQATGTFALKWTMECVFDRQVLMEVFEKNIKIEASDIGIVVHTAQMRERCSPHFGLRCVAGSNDPVLAITASLCNL